MIDFLITASSFKRKFGNTIFCIFDAWNNFLHSFLPLTSCVNLHFRFQSHAKFPYGLRLLNKNGKKEDRYIQKIIIRRWKISFLYPSFFHYAMFIFGPNPFLNKSCIFKGENGRHKSYLISVGQNLFVFFSDISRLFHSGKLKPVIFWKMS